MWREFLLGVSMMACAALPDAGNDSDVDGLASLQARVHCGFGPTTGPKESWQRWRSNLIAAQSPVLHRGIDLVANVATTTQVLRGELSYGLADKALEQEDVEIFVCGNTAAGAAWRKLGRVRTSSEGQFALALTGPGKLDVGKHELYLSVPGDRSAARFSALIVPAAGMRMVVTDVDGTLTTSENAYTTSLPLGGEVNAHAGAAATLQALAQKGLGPLYLTSRGDQFTADTRYWIRDQGMPAGMVRLSSDMVTIPGAGTADFKAAVLAEYRAAGVTFVMGIGNRISDAQAYQAAGVPAAAILLKQPEYADETAAMIQAGHARGFTNYGELTPLVDGL